MDELIIAREGPVTTVTFNRPERRNALTEAMYAALKELCGELANDADARVLVLRGHGGKAFAAGNEITDFLARDPAAYEGWIRDLMAQVHALPQVTIAAVDGVCVGGGLGLAVHCDLRIATEHSRFGYPIARTLGNALSAGVLYRTVATFGEPMTKEMLLTGRLIDAPRALAVGALAQVTADLDAELEKLTGDIVAGSGVTQRASKSQLHSLAARLERPPDNDDELVAAVYGGPDFAEGVRAFSAKERPRFAPGRVG